MSTLTPAESQVIITGGEVLSGASPAPAVAIPSCDILVNDARALYRQLNAAAKMPIKMLQFANKVINKVSDEALYLTDQAIGAIEDLVNAPLSYLNDPNLSLTNSISALTNMLNCAYVIGNKDLISALTDALAMLNAGRVLWHQLPHMFRKYIGNAIYNGMASIINDQLRNQAVGKLNSLASNYNKMLKTTGIKKMLTDMDNLITCVSGTCTAMSGVVDQVNTIYQKLGLDDGGNPYNIFENSTLISSSKKYIISKASTRIDNVYASLNGFLTL